MVFSNWLELPNHLQALLMNKLLFIKDYIHFGAVCRSWRSVFDQYIDIKKLPRPQLPLLMFPSSSYYPSSMDHHHHHHKKHKRDEKWNFYSLTQRTVYDFGIKLPNNRYCRGSSHGWLVTVDIDNDFSVRIFNPFLPYNNEIQLPPLKSFELNPPYEKVYEYLFLKKVILSKDPTIISISNTKQDDDDDDDDLVVIAIHGEVYRLAFYKPGDKSWTVLTHNWFGIADDAENYKNMLHGFADITYYKSKVYAVQWEGTVVSFDMPAIIAAAAAAAANASDHQQHPKPNVIRKIAISRPFDSYGGNMKYIVESSGDLLQVQRYDYQDDNNQTKEYFRVFKLLLDLTSEEDDEENKSKWVEVNTLHGCVLFLGDNASISISLSDCPGCKPNCIYFTQDDFEKYWLDEFPSVRDIGVFNLEDPRNIEQHYPMNPEASIFPPPIWVQPTLTVLLKDIYRQEHQ